MRGSWALSVQSGVDSFYCQVSFSPALKMKSKEKKNNLTFFLEGEEKNFAKKAK